jgi:hypothetical protein
MGWTLHAWQVSGEAPAGVPELRRPENSLAAQLLDASASERATRRDAACAEGDASFGVCAEGSGMSKERLELPVASPRP